ncbi:MAG: T9SS type A sorting domain-containing protein [Bacteroidia bacterium]|nr:T9SS type A sorting domain-containing protein [Bacteroidia bacterium]
MKRKITLLLLAASTIFSLKSQVVLQEGFTATWTPAGAGWSEVNLSTSPGTLGWFQGNSTVFSALSGGPNDYYAANFNSQATTPGGISNWLITPVVNIYNGAVFQFATRTPAVPTASIFPDGLQLRMSTSGTNSTIPTGTTSVGPFTTLLLDINPNLTTNTTAAVSNGSVNGYPNAWTVYSVQISGVTGTVQGRFAFRYFVNDGGPNGANSSYIGIDDVSYTLPCGASVMSYTTCANTASTLQATGLPATTYSWSTGASASSVVVSPASTTVYTVYPMVSGSLCGTSFDATITIGPGPVINVSSSSSSICAGETVTLSAVSPLGNYTWAQGSITNTFSTAQTVTVNPSTTTTYSVGSLSGSCGGYTSVIITVAPNPTVTIATTSTLLCVSGPSTAVSFTGNGAQAYLWVLGSATANGTVVNVNIPAQTTTTSASYQQTLGLLGQDANGCISSDIFTLTVAKNPTVSVTSTTASACTNATVNITASATNSSNASTFVWSGAQSGTTNPLTFSTGATAGTKVFTLVAKSAEGCSTTATFSQNVVVCNTNTTTTGLSEVNGYQETAIFPNPFTSEINVNVLDGKVIIYNAIGQEVMNVSVHSQETINTADLPKGAYFVKALNSNGEVVKTVKLVKQ